MLCGVRTAQRCGVKAFRLPDGAGPKEEEYEVCRALYMLLRAETGVRPPWGMLTGVRPVRLLHDMRRRGLSPAQQQAFFCRRNDVSAEKYKLAVEIANNQQDVIKRSTLRSYSLYISIPFCPSRCSYCSFVSTTTEKSGALVAPYLQRLEQELQSIAAMAEKLRLRLETVYIGGGTPTAVSAQQLARLMAAVRGAFDFSHVREFTVEAGRPDCTTPEKLAAIREGRGHAHLHQPADAFRRGAARHWRRHSAQDVLDCFAAARKAGHRNINMDLIAGLPLDTPAGFEKSLAGVLALSPENITVHTLTLKRASNLVMQDAPPAYGDVAQMVQHSVCARCKAPGMGRITSTARRAPCRTWKIPAGQSRALRGFTTSISWKRCIPFYQRARAALPSWWARRAASSACSTTSTRWNIWPASTRCWRASRK